MYKREKSLLDHVCNQKRRFFEKDTKPARLAFHAFTHWHSIHMRGTKPPTHDKFMQSTYYDAFLNFGKYILDIHAVNPTEYIDWMVRSGIKLDHWCRDVHYLKYMRELTLKESPDRAFERTVMLMEDWAVKHRARWQDFFREIAPPLAVDWLMAGRLSPWVMLNCASGHDLMAKFTDEQMELVKDALNIRLWNGKFSRHTQVVKDFQAALGEEGL